MSSVKKVGSLEIEHDFEFQKKEWQVERVAWAVMALIVLAALLGLFGRGPLSSVNDESGPVSVRYSRFERMLSPAKLEVEVAPEAAQREEIRLQVSRDWLEAFDIEKITPEPDSVEFAGNSLIYVFKVSQAGQPQRVVFDLQGAKAGSFKGPVGLENGESVQVSQFIYP